MSGIDAAACTTSSTVTGEGELEASATCADLAGNVATGTRTVRIDRTAPAAAPVASATGWSAGDVTVTWNWSDAGSGLDGASCPATSTSTGEGVITLSASCTDLAGNTATATQVVQVDKTAPAAAPVQSPAANAAGWVNADATVAWGWADAGSGIDAGNCTTSSTSTGEGTTVLAVTCADLVGNTASATQTVKVDKTAPTVAFSGASSYGVDATVSITCAASDAGSGIAASSCPSVSAPASSLVGTNTLTASATDAAGNTASATFTYTVTVSASSLCALVHQLSSSTDVANGLCDKITQIAAAKSTGKTKVASNVQGALDNQLRAQTGKALTAASAALISSLAAQL